MQAAEVPDRDKADLIVQLLLDLVQQRLPFLTVTLPGLLGVPGVDLRVFNPRLCPLTVHKGFEARGRIAEGPAHLERQVFQRLLSMGRGKGGAL